MKNFEYHDAISFSMALGKTFEEAKNDWNSVNSMQPVWCQIIKNYPCECEKILPAA